MYTQTQTTGNLTVSHYMTLLQKLTSIINKDLMIDYFNLPPNYNFKVDVKNTRWRNTQKDYNRYLLQTNPQGLNRIIQFINSNIDQISKSDVPAIFKYINDISGYVAIQFDRSNLLVNISSSSSYKYAIIDNDLQKQKQIKQLRNAAKAKRDTFTKEDVAGKIWKYRYLPPDPRTEFFERNTKEVTKFREIKPVLEFTRIPFTEPGVDFKKKIKPL
jgi:hypothetical protein